MKNYLKQNKVNIIIFVIIFTITSAIYFPLLKGHYATDTYNIINKGYETYAITYSLNDGRPIMCLISLIAQKLNMPIMVYVIILTAIALIVSNISVIKLKNITVKYIEEKNKKTEYIILAIAYIIIFNFAYLENLQFAECAIMSVSILLNIIAAQQIVEKKKNYILKSIIISILSIQFYQGTMNWLFTITFVLSLLKEKKINMQVIKNVLFSVLCGALGCGVNMIQIKITGKIFGLTQSRMGSIKNIFSNINVILESLNGTLQSTYGLFPKNMLYIFLIVILIYSLIFMRKNKCNITLNLLAIILICIGTVYGPSLFTLSAFGTGRMAFSIGAMIGLMLLYIYCNLENNKIEEAILYSIMFLYIFISIGSSIIVMEEHKIVNNLDKQESQIVGKWIEEYEEQNNIEVKNVVFMYNSNSKLFYSDLSSGSALCYKSLVKEWSRIGALNYYNNRKFLEQKNKSLYYQEYFSNKKWDKLDKEQLIFDGDTLYYCLY